MTRHDLHTRVGGWFGWERDWLFLDHFELGQFGLLAREEVKHDLCPEVGRADAQAGLTGEICYPATLGQIEEREEPRAGVNRAAPGVGELDALQFWERAVEARDEFLEGVLPVVI